MLEYLDGFKTKLVGNLQTTSDIITLPMAWAKKLDELVEGNHVYLTIKYLDRYEVVKYTKDSKIKNGMVPVERDVLGKGRKNFPCGSCVLIDWNSVQLKEFICATKCQE